MEMKTFIECTYKKMNSHNIVGNSEESSTDYLGKSKSSFRAMKAKVLEANICIGKACQSLRYEGGRYLLTGSKRREPRAINL